VRSKDAKDRVDKLMARGNREQTYAAPWICIVAYDLGFPGFMRKLAPHTKDPKTSFTDPMLVEWLAIQNGSLGGAFSS
jgi:3-hydroxypropanoate dehydrogenase